MLPKKGTMELLAKRLTRKKFPCHIETQDGAWGKEYIIRCNWIGIEQPLGDYAPLSYTPSGSVLPFKRKDKYYLNVNVSLGGIGAYPSPIKLPKWVADAGFKSFNATTKPKFEKKGFRITTQYRKGYAFSILVYGEIEVPKIEPFSPSFMDLISDFINETIRDFMSKTKQKYSKEVETRREIKGKQVPPGKVTRNSLRDFLVGKGFEEDRWGNLKKITGGRTFRWKLLDRTARREMQVTTIGGKKRWVKEFSAYYKDIKIVGGKIKVLKYLG
jgi:hypothetical protein